MPIQKRTWTKARSEYAQLVKEGHSKSEPEMVALLGEMKGLKLEDHIRQILKQKPPMTQEQRGRIAALLSPS